MARSTEQTLQYLLGRDSRASSFAIQVYTYTAYARNAAGDDFSTSYNEGLHHFRANIYVNAPIIDLDASYFAGHWVPISGGVIFGADIYILPTEPNSPKPGDIWYNTSLLYQVINISGIPATPVSDIPSGLYHEAVDVELTCATPGAEIHYTLDGTNPTLTSPIFTQTLKILESTVIKYVSYADGHIGTQGATTLRLNRLIGVTIEGEDEYNIRVNDNMIEAIAPLTLPKMLTLFLPPLKDHKGREIYIVKPYAEGTIAVTAFENEIIGNNKPSIDLLSENASILVVSDGEAKWIIKSLKT